MLDLAIITEELLVGTQVTSSEDLDTLRSLGVGGVLSLQEDRDLAAAGTRWDILQQLALQFQIEMRRCPVADFDPSDLIGKLDSCTAALAELLSEHRRVYVHCTAGINRSTGTVLAYLVMKRGMTVDAAYRLIKSRRPQANPYRNLLEYLSSRQRIDRTNA